MTQICTGDRQRGLLLTAHPGKRWKAALTSVRKPKQQLAVAIFRSSWKAAVRSRAGLVRPMM
jgi:hypothetical protein